MQGQLVRRPRRPRRHGLGVASALVLSALALQGCEWPERARQPPDIILIMVDTLRADYVGSYGFDGEVSPAVDRLASESIVYDNAVAPSPWTKPSIASLFTSLDPITHRVVDHQRRFWRQVAASEKTDALAEGAWTLAEALGELGYETAAWVANPWIDKPEWGFNQGFDHFHERRDKNADQMIREIRGWLEERAESPTGERPLFLYLHFMDVHGPYQSTAELLERFSRSESLGDDRILTPSERKAIGYLGDRTPWRASEKGRHLKSWRAAYAGGVRLFDDRLGPFIDWLRSSERLERSVLVFTSDHGEDLLEHGRWHHGYSPTLFQHSIKIPLMIRLPGEKGRGRRDDRMTGLLDVMPTLLHLAGRRDVPPELEGSVLLDSEGRGSAEATAWAFSGAVADNPRAFSIQDRDFKLIWEFPQGPMKLYDLRNDPGERVNLASGEPWPGPASSSRREVEHTMARTLAERIQRLRARPSLLKTQKPLDPDTLEKLKDLGYVQ